jgi:hypothetical protein
MKSDPEGLQRFLKMLPVTVIRDMMYSANNAMEREQKTREDIFCSLDYALKYHLKTANATLHLLERSEKMQDPEVEYVQEMVKTSQGILSEKQAACRAAGVLEDKQQEEER